MSFNTSNIKIKLLCYITPYEMEFNHLGLKHEQSIKKQ